MNALGRIVRSADFERVLATSPRARSAHFALHHAPRGEAKKPELSTAGARATHNAVDELPGEAPEGGLQLGMVVPKRHARRSVTRTLVKRQIRNAVARHAGRLNSGLWVVRLRAPFPVAQFPAAASTALRDAARSELDTLLARAGRP